MSEKEIEKFFFKGSDDYVEEIEPYETTSDVDTSDIFLAKQESNTAYDLDGLIIETEIDEEDYTVELIESITSEMEGVAYLKGAVPYKDAYRLKWVMIQDTPEKKQEFLKKASKYGLTVVSPPDMKMIPPQKRTNVISYLTGNVHPEHLMRIAKQLSFDIESPRYFQKEGKVFVSSAKVIRAYGKGAEIMKKCEVIADKLGIAKVVISKFPKLEFICVKA